MAEDRKRKRSGSDGSHGTSESWALSVAQRRRTEVDNRIDANRQRLNRWWPENGDIYAERLEEETTRVLVLYKGSGSDELKCDLRKIHLTQEPAYENLSYDALSYVWGSEENPPSILLCGHRFWVTQNLAEALQHLRLADSDRMLWVDAICINQHNLDERHSQIRLMHRIYKHAETVIAWLGGADAGTCDIFNYMNAAQNMNLPRELYPITYSTNPEASDPWESLTARPYWSRAWVVQERMFARSVVVQCGLSKVSWASLENAYSPERRSFVSVRSDNDHARRTHFTNDYAMRLPNARQPFVNQFLECLLDKQCRERQDNIFAFSNLFPDDIKKCIPIDYESSPSQVLVQTAQAIINCTKSLYIFAIRGRQVPPRASEESWQARMPSWCPYLATPYKSPPIEPQDSPSVFAEEMAVSFLVGGRLRVRGFMIGRISKEVSRKMPAGDETGASLSSFDPFQEWKYYLKCLCVGMTRMPRGAPRSVARASVRATTRTLLAGQHKGNFKEDDLFQLIVEGMEADVDEDTEATTVLKEISTNTKSRLVCSFLLDPAVCRALWSSKMAPAVYVNRIALVPDTARKGDAICMILGCPLAVVLRRSGTSYRILGEAFIDTSAMGPFNVAVGLRDFIIK